MLHMVVMVAGQPNYIGAYSQLHSTLCFKEWEALVQNSEDALCVWIVLSLGSW